MVLLLISLENSNALFLTRWSNKGTHAYKLLMIIAKQSSRCSNEFPWKQIGQTHISRSKKGGGGVLNKFNRRGKKRFLHALFYVDSIHSIVCTLSVVLCGFFLLVFFIYSIKFWTWKFHLFPERDSDTASNDFSLLRTTVIFRIDDVALFFSLLMLAVDHLEFLIWYSIAIILICVKMDSRHFLSH